MSKNNKTYRYSTNDSKTNRLIRFALWDEWGRECYWCKNPLTDSTEAEIDHLIPRNPDDVEQLQSFSIDAESFDYDGLANLAPICAARKRCNQEKSNRVLGTPSFEDKVHKAVLKATAVNKRIERLESARGLEQKLIQIITVELDPHITDLFKEYGDNLVQRLRTVDRTLLTDYVAAWNLEGHLTWSQVPEIGLGHRASLVPLRETKDLRVLEHFLAEIYQLDLKELLNQELEHLGRLLSDEVKSDLTSVLSFDIANLDVFKGYHLANVELALGSFELSISGGSEAVFEGTVGQDFVANATTNNQDGDFYPISISRYISCNFTLILRDQGGELVPDLELSDVVLDDPEVSYL